MNKPIAAALHTGLAKYSWNVEIAWMLEHIQ